MHHNASNIDGTGYRPDIDGLRAVSILLVIVFHAFPPAVSGGFVGVDVFFVISGFLITRLIVSEVSSQTFSLRGFYARRVRRIFPALICVLIFTYLAGWFVLLPNDFAALGKNICSSAAFIFNLTQIRSAGYFGSDASSNPLLHIWSLGIEEQFYIFWPLFIAATLAGRRFRLAISGIALASFAINLAFTGSWPEFAFYSPLSRGWELLAGGMLSVRPRRGSHGAFDNQKSLAGICLIIGGAALLDQTSPYPGWNALLPVIGAVLLIDAPGSLINRRFLSAGPMVQLGLISYPLYLWHWPLLSYLSILRNGVPNLLENLGAVIVAVVFSWATYRFVEIPIRKSRYPVRSLALGMIVVGITGAGTMLAGGIGFRFPAEIRDIAALSPNDNRGFRTPCFLEEADASAFNETCVEQGTAPLVFLWGDSTAASLYPGLDQAREKHHFRIAQFTTAACAPVVAPDRRCGEVNTAAINFVRSSRPAVVLMQAMWNKDLNLVALHHTITMLREIGVPRIVILGPVPVWKRTLPNAIVNYYRLRHVIPERLSSGVAGAGNDEFMEQVAKAEGVEYISAWRALCNSDGCLATIANSADGVVTLDIVHLSNNGAAFLVDEIADRLFVFR
jgi:peptidoglycan/LPS O-acetylase OafA/YrhL